MTGTSLIAANHGVTERLIRRLRVSDPPDRFQKRATAAVREALGVEAVAWVPGTHATASTSSASRTAAVALFWKRSGGSETLSLRISLSVTP